MKRFNKYKYKDDYPQQIKSRFYSVIRYDVQKSTLKR